MSDQGPMPEGQPYPQPYGEQPYAAPGYSQPYAEPTYPQQPYGQQPYAASGYPQPYAASGYPEPYGQQPYPQPYAGYGYAMPTPATNTLAVVALVSGIIGLVAIPIIGSIVAVVTGPMSRKQIRETGEAGDGMAVAGLITGWIGLGIWLAIVAFAIILPLIIVGAAASSTAG